MQTGGKSLQEGIPRLEPGNESEGGKRYSMKSMTRKISIHLFITQYAAPVIMLIMTLFFVASPSQVSIPWTRWATGPSVLGSLQAVFLPTAITWGGAPQAKLYALKITPDGEGWAYESDMIAAWQPISPNTNWEPNRTTRTQTVTAALMATKPPQTQIPWTPYPFRPQSGLLDQWHSLQFSWVFKVAISRSGNEPRSSWPR